jgi:hypothetical protein
MLMNKSIIYGTALLPVLMWNQRTGRLLGMSESSRLVQDLLPIVKPGPVFSTHFDMERYRFTVHHYSSASRMGNVSPDMKENGDAI